VKPSFLSFQVKYEKSQNGAFFARDENVWIRTFQSLASKLRELFEVKNNRIGSDLTYVLA